MTCINCGGSDVRRSSHARWMDSFRLPLGQRALRCRTCLARFYGRPGPEVTAAAVGDPIRRSRKTGTKHRRRWIVEAIIFVVLLLLFGSFLKYLTREEASSDTTNLRRSPVPGLPT